MLAVDYKFPTPPSEKGELKEIISSMIALGEVKEEEKDNCFSPFEKFASFIEYYSEFHRLIRSLCYVFHVVKACCMKENKERKDF